MKSITKTWTMIICCMFLCGFAPVASAAGYLYFEGVDGESNDPEHPGWIDVLSIEWNLDATATSDKRGTSGEISDIKITIASDASSPYIQLACMQGKSISSLDFDFVDDTGRLVRTLRLGDVRIKTVGHSTRSGVVPTDQITMGYTKIELTHYPADRDQAPAVFVWTRPGN